MSCDLVGIYMITCLKNDKHYIGQSVRLKHRMKEHESCSSNTQLREDIALYGLENFRFEILEECKEEELDERELHYIEVIKPEYNVCMEGNPFTQKNLEIIRELSRKPVRCVEDNRVFPSQRDAANAYDVCESSLCNVLHGKQVTVGGFHFEYADERPSETRENKTKKPVRCVEMGIVFPTIAEAAKAVGINSRTISAALNGQSFTAAGFHWKFADGRPANIRPEETRKPKKKPVRCIETGVIYESIAQAAKTFDLCSTTIGHAANGEYEKAGGYHWEFVDKQSHKPYKKNPQQKRGKAVRCIETQEVFKTMSKAAECVGISVASISRALNGKVKMAGVYHWEFVKENIDLTPVKKSPKTTAKPVRCVETGEVFRSMREAADHFGIHSSGIGHALHRRKKTAGGYHWEFATSMP